MSRLDSYIRRMQAQKLCLDHAARLIGTRPGIILELGFGNGRTYDHLRELFPGRKVYVFDRQINPHPDSVPINALLPVPGTPLEERTPHKTQELVRMCASARIVMPRARVRLSAGRRSLSREAQILCFLAGANSLFYGEKLLTTANNDADDDDASLREARGEPRAAARGVAAE